MAGAKHFEYPIGFDDTAGACLAFNREELKGFAEKFNCFDENRNGFIDYMELKRAQEKMGQPKTHTELTKLMQEMAKDVKQGISFYDFICVQAKLVGKTMSGGKLELKEVDGSSSFMPLTQAFAQACKDFSVTGIKDFHEAKMKSTQAELERQKAISDKLTQRKDAAEANRKAREALSIEQKKAAQKAKEDREREEAEKKAAEEKRKADRAAFQAKSRAAFEAGGKS